MHSFITPSRELLPNRASYSCTNGGDTITNAKHVYTWARNRIANIGYKYKWTLI